MEALLATIASFSSTSLEEMNAIKLLNRQDTKYIARVYQLDQILKDLKDFYNVLEIKGKRIVTYENLYYDTKDFNLFQLHQRGKLNRTKFRIRKYVESDISFIEIKKKTNKNRTVKNRISLPPGNNFHGDFVKKFIEENTSYKRDDLSQEINITFQRMTLAHKNLEDRCTLDFNLKASWGAKTYFFDNLVIAELKQEKFKHSSPFNLCLKANKVYPESISKYCFSLIKLNPSLKWNNFKPKIKQLEKILHD